MPLTQVPTKQAVRDYLDRRAHENEPPPSIEEIRRQLGWDLIPRSEPPPERND